MITTIGVSLVVQNLILVATNFANNVPYPQLIPNERWGIGGVEVTLKSVLLWISALILMLILDFVVRLTDDRCLIVETKGQEDLDVALKDRRARRWCGDATRLAGRAWAYEKVSQKVFDAYTGQDLDGLRRFIAVGATSRG